MSLLGCFSRRDNDPRSTYTPTTTRIYPSATSFVRCGRRILRQENLRERHVKLFHTPMISNLHPVFRLAAKTKVCFTTRLSGFMDLGRPRDGFIHWERFWCVMEDGKLRFWPYPPAVGDEAADPQLVINLRTCVNKEVKQAQRNECSRRRTILLEVAEKGEDGGSSSRKVNTYFFSLRCNADLLLWLDDINHVVTTLTQWGCSRCA